MNAPYIKPPDDDGWTAHIWVRAEIGPHLSVDLMTGHNLLTDNVDAPVLLIDGIPSAVEIRDRQQLDGLIAALDDARRVWDALNP